MDKDELLNFLMQNSEDVESLDQLDEVFFSKLLSESGVDCDPKLYYEYFKAGLLILPFQDFSVKIKDGIYGFIYKINEFSKCYQGVTDSVFEELKLLGFIYNQVDDILYKEYGQEDINFLNIISTSIPFDVSDKV